jgi:hypothetical protein
MPALFTRTSIGPIARSMRPYAVGDRGGIRHVERDGDRAAGAE